MTDTTEHPGFVVVGVDDTEGSRLALDFAIREALARGATVEVVTAWHWNSPYEGIALASTAESAHAEASAMQERVVQEALDRFEQKPTLSQVVVHEYAGPGLVARSDGALMLVVGTERKGMISRAILGSVSEHCVRHASCPVVVIPDPTRLEHHSHGSLRSTAGAGA